METPGLTEKPLFKMNEVCSLFKVTKPTIYDWVKCGKLKKVKIRSRVYFLGEDIRKLIQA
jgi:excisionase family DNA binding protein